jgi:anti-anti-sigma factor
MSPESEPMDTTPDDVPFRCEVVRDGDTARVRAIGELDLDTVPALAAEIAHVREAGCPRVIIDLSELTFLDSSGLRLVLDSYAEARRDSHTLALIPGPRAVQRVFELTGTSEQLPFIAP